MNEQPKSRAAHTKLLDALGEQIEEIMQSAEEQAGEIVANAERESTRRIEDAQRRADALVDERAAWLVSLHEDLVERASSAREASLDFVGAIHDAARQLQTQPAVAPAASEPQAETLDDTPEQTPSEAEGSGSTGGPIAEGKEPTGRSESKDEGSPAELLENLRDRLNRSGKRPMRLTRATPDSADEPAVERTILPKPGPDSKGASEGAKLLATQMAVSGSSREEIERRLRDEFHISDTAPILDSVLK